MAFEPPDGILDIGNATLRVGKLEVAETSGLNQGLQNIIKNDLLITENTEYTTNQKWGLKLPTTWVGEFEVKGHSGKYIDFNFYNENSASNAQGYNLTFMDTTMTLRYDGGSALGGGAVTIPTIVGAYRKVNIFFERGVISVSIDGTRYLYHKESDGFNQGLGVASRVVSATGSAFVNVFIESDNENNSKFKNLRIVNGRFISDKTSNIAFIGGNLGVGVNSPKETLDILGNMHLTRVSNVSQISVDSNVVTEYTGPHDRPLRKYPEVALTVNSIGGYIASSSGAATNYPEYKAFNNEHSSTDAGWATDYIYNMGTGTVISGNTFEGENGGWLNLQVPNPIKVKYFIIKAYPSTTYGNPPRDIRLFGSNDGSSWDLLKTETDMDTDSGKVYTCHVNATKHYKHIRLQVTKIHLDGNTSYARIAELEYYGHEEGSGSLDTTLKTVYNVPATTGTQLEVYYDAKDLADGAVSTPVLGLGGTTINATVYGDPQVSGGAFVFDGTGDYIKTSALPSTFVDDAQHSFSTWFKLDTTTGSQTLFTIGNADGDNELPHVVVQDGTLRYDFYNNSRTLLDLSLVPNQWYHLVITFSGGNHNSGTKFYINGVYDANVNSGGNSPNATLDIQASSPLTIGGRHNGTQLVAGSIANFRLYSKALNAGQIKELYDYQKDYFLGSKSQVTLYKGHLGVGVTEPSGQLELAGDERIQEYPPRGLYQHDTHVEGHGVFCVSVSAEHNIDHQVWEAFGDNATSGSSESVWNSLGGMYATGATGAYISSTTTSGIKGEWIQMKTPYKVKISSFILDSYATSGRRPRDFVLLGSNDGNVWEQMKSVSGQTTGYTMNSPYATSIGGPRHTVNSTKFYTYFRIVITNVQPSTDGLVAVGRLRFFGTPGPTTLDKGSLSLTRSLDVPRVSRYDVDTETPRPEKLVLDFDTTVNSSPTDISGKGNHGTFYNGASYSPADKAFSFDGTDDYIQGSCPASLSGNVSYTISLWVKFDTITTNNYDGIVEIGDRATDTTSGTFPSIFVYHGANLGFYFSNGGAIVNSGVLPVAGRWYHLVGVYDQGGNKGHFYIDGGTTFIGSGTPANTTNFIGTASVFLGGDSTADSGQYLDGKISNFKLYDVALEPSEVKKLYNLGRTGRSMVISDTAVGIGKVPEAQLDVRGNLKVSGHAFPETMAPRYYTSIKTGRFTGASNPILTGFDNVGDGHSEPMGWEVHINFNTTSSSDIEVYMDGFYTSNAPTTHVAIREHGTRRQRQDNLGTTFYHDKFYLGSYIAANHAPIYSVIRILNSHGQHSSIHTYSTSTVRYHAWGETVYVHPGVGTTIDYGMGNLRADGANQRLHGIRLTAQSNGITGDYTIFAIK